MKSVDDIEGAGWTVLTARERDVIHPVAEGKSNKLIAMELGISMRTVEAHRARIFYKMGVRNAVQLAREVCINPEPPVDEGVKADPVSTDQGQLAGGCLSSSLIGSRSG